MRTLLSAFIFMLFNQQVNAADLEMEKACISIPGFVDCKRVSESSFWVLVDNQYENHNYDFYGELLCNGGEKNFEVEKGYSITFWGRNKKELAKYRCY